MSNELPERILAFIWVSEDYVHGAHDWCEINDEPPDINAVADAAEYLFAAPLREEAGRLLEALDVTQMNPYVRAFLARLAGES